MFLKWVRSIPPSSGIGDMNRFLRSSALIRYSLYTYHSLGSVMKNSYQKLTEYLKLVSENESDKTMKVTASIFLAGLT
jgi:hypothetical protein